MKKIITLMFLSILAFNANLSAMEKKQELIEQKTESKFTKMDWFKLGTAAFGCIWFTTATTTCSIFLQQVKSEKWLLLLIPQLPIFLPLGIAADKLLNYHIFPKQNEQSNELREQMKKVSIVSSILSGLVAAGLGTYVHKKIAQLKKSKQQPKDLTK